MTVSNTDLFSQADGSLDDNYEQTGVTATQELLESLVGEGKRYKTINDLAFAKINADAHIKRMAEENKALREAQQRASALEDLVKSMRETSQVTKDDDPSDTKAGGAGALDADTIVAQVLTSLEERTKQQQERENMAVVKKTIAESLGPNWQAELKAKVEDSGLSEQEADVFARRNPKAFFKLLGINTEQKATNSLFNSVPATTVNSTASTVQSNGVNRTKSYYDSLKKKMGVQAFMANRDLVAQQHNDALRLKEAFFDT